jgi:hypothetical protein
MNPAFTRLTTMGAAILAAVTLAVAPANSVSSSCEGIKISIGDKEGYEHYRGSPLVAGFQVAAEGCSDTEVVVTYATQDGEAPDGADGTDYKPTRNQLSWPAGVPASDQWVYVPIENNPELDKPKENFYVDLTWQTGRAQILKRRAMGTIKDGQASAFTAPPVISIQGTYCWLPPQNVCRPTFVAHEYFDNPVTIRYQTFDGTAKAGRDYVPISEGVAVIEKGQLTGYGAVRYGQAPGDGRHFFVRVVEVPGGNIANHTAAVTLSLRR